MVYYLLCTSCNIMIWTSCVYIGIDVISRMKNAKCNSTVLHDSGSYNTSFLKLSQLLLAGDVESNPGPVTNNTETPKGRGRPKKAKIGFAKKLDFTNADTIVPVNFANQDISNKIRGESKFEILTLSVNPTLRGWGGQPFDAKDCNCFFL